MLTAQTARLIIRPLRLDEAPVVAAYRSDEEVSRYVPWTPPYPIEKARELIGKSAERSAGLAPGEWSMFAIERASDGVVIGDCVVKQSADDPRQVIFGYVLAREHHGKGYATEAMEAFVGALFRTCDLHRISAYVFEANRASRRVVEKIGFRREAHHIESLFLKGAYQTEFIYAMLRREWELRSRAATNAGVRHVPTQEGYDAWSAIYDSDGNPLISLEERIAHPMLSDVRGVRIADIGCGTGRHALRLAGLGAEVTAVDFSDGMLGVARSKPGAENVRWVRHDLHTPLPFADGSFDRVVCALVVDHIHDIPAFMGELGRICARGPNSSILITSMHPAMMLRGVQARFMDPTHGATTMPQSVPNQLSDYVSGAVRAGLTIDLISEHMVDDALIAENPRAEKHRGWPLLVVMRMRP